MTPTTMAGDSYLSKFGGGVRIEVWAKPRASKTCLDRIKEGALGVRVAAPPVDGEANTEVIRFFAKLLGVPKRDVEIISGHNGRRKSLRIADIQLKEVRTLIAAALG